jgi:hypothetical protein
MERDHDEYVGAKCIDLIFILADEARQNFEGLR